NTSATPLPAGLSKYGDQISGTPVTADIGTNTIFLSASNALGTDNKALTLTVTASPPLINSAPTRSGMQSSAFTHALTAAATPTVTWTATGLPSGLSLNGATISGTPSLAAVGAHVVGITATNPYGVDTQNLTIVIEPLLAI